MAQEVPISGAEKPAKIRSPWAPALLPFITLGIYFFFWWYYINREMADYGKSQGSDELGDSPGKSVLAVSLGALIIVPAIISIINTFKRAQTAQRMTGQEPEPLNGWIGLVLYLVLSPAFNAYLQSGLNNAWRQVAQGGVSAPMEAAPAEPMPQPAEPSEPMPPPAAPSEPSTPPEGEN
jgi:Domain of unknown function (DUF4234)